MRSSARPPWRPSDGRPRTHILRSSPIGPRISGCPSVPVHKVGITQSVQSVDCSRSGDTESLLRNVSGAKLTVGYLKQPQDVNLDPRGREAATSGSSRGFDVSTSRTLPEVCL